MGTTRRNSRRRTGYDPSLEPMEGRRLLSGAAGKFAVYQGRTALTSTDDYTLALNRNNVRNALGNRVLLRIDAEATDGTFDPAAVGLASSSRWGVWAITARNDSGSGKGAVTIASVAPGTLTIRPRAQAGTTGGYQIGVSLAGDVDGNFRVDRADLAAIRSALRAGPASTVPAGTDVNGDGVTNLRDWAIALRNLGARTSLRPLELTSRVDPADDPEGDNVVGEDVERTALTGKTAPGSIVRLDAGGDGTIDAMTTAAADGTYRFAVGLATGVNPFVIRAEAPDGQVARQSVSVVRGRVAAVVRESFDFTRGAQGWTSGFADIPASPNPSYELDSGIRDLPADLGTGGTGYLLQSHNRSDDAFMFLTRKLTAADGVVARQSYRISFTLKFASNAPSGSAGIGGAPGESVYLKAGASAEEPSAVDQGGMLRMNVDKGNNAVGGPAASVAGNIANGLAQGSGASVPYVSITREHTHTAVVTADAQGNLWLLVGTDSGFEGLTTIYVQGIDATLTPVTG
ncbi:dockerin type I domain-containing protein [Aquisphaera insulae]|uniref:dockerin type I domain-containing protein n=1 Tax=Aquisphaera insulae TaxID=2712864 RepID=UPI0013EA4735|nr:dockerin type I domain-containing protein [Aquisphaera insulae]